MLLSGLPADSSTARAALGPAAVWANNEELLAVIADRVADLVWLTVEINRDPKRQPQPFPQPPRLPRPTLSDAVEGRTAARTPSPRRRHMTVAEMKQLVAGADGMAKGG